MTNTGIKPLSSKQVGKDLAQVIAQTEALFERAGLSHKETTLDVWTMFDQLPDDQCRNILEAAKIRYGVFKNAMLDKIPFESNQKGLREALKELKLKAHDDLYDRLDKDLVIDIYNSNHLQIYHNKVFQEVSSYSYLELSALPWFELFERPSYCTLYLFQQAEELFLSSRKELVEVQLEDYCLKETAGKSKLECVIHHEFICPATDESGRVKALIYANKIKRVFESDGKLKYL